MPSEKKKAILTDLLLTPEERDWYVNQLRDFKEHKLPELSRRQSELKPGDTDELDDLMEERPLLEGAIRNLERWLSQAGTISTQEAAKSDYARIGSHVLVRKQDGKECTYVIGLTLYDLPGRASGIQGSTWGSGVTNALLGKRAGEDVVVSSPGGK